jgi:hypothetical protein
VAGLVLVLAGVAIGRLAAPSPVDQAVPPTSPATPAPSSPGASVEPNADEGSRTPQGAARAAARALSSLADARLLADPARRRAIVSGIAVPAYRPEVIPLFDGTYRHLAGLLGDSARDGEVILQMTPLGYRVEAFSARRATVAVWQVTLLATPERAPIAAWSTSRAELVWSGGRWKVERFGTDSPGPTPSVTAPATTSAPGEFVDLARDLSRFGP